MPEKAWKRQDGAQQAEQSILNKRTALLDVLAFENSTAKSKWVPDCMLLGKHNMKAQ